MAFLFVGSSPHKTSSVVQSAIKGLKLLFLSAGLVSTLLMMKAALMPYSCEVVFSNLVVFWNSIRCFLSSPLYICIIINSMVLLIAVTSTFHCHETDNHDPPPPFVPRDVTEVEPPPPHETLPSRIEVCYDSTLYQDLSQHIEGKMETRDPHSYGKEKEESLEMETEVTDNQSDEKESEEDDTLEATWKAIAGAKTKQLKKSDTWAPRGTAAAQSLHSPTTSWKDLRKSETFNEAVSIRRIGGLRRDPSIGIDEFNQKVEAFIKNFNEDMRLQRQESDQRFMDMIKRGL